MAGPFLEAVLETSEGMPDAKTHEQKFEAMVDDVKKATVLIISYRAFISPLKGQADFSTLLLAAASSG